MRHSSGEMEVVLTVFFHLTNDQNVRFLSFHSIVCEDLGLIRYDVVQVIC